MATDMSEKDQILFKIIQWAQLSNEATVAMTKVRLVENNDDGATWYDGQAVAYSKCEDYLRGLLDRRAPNTIDSGESNESNQQSESKEGENDGD